MHRPDYMYLQAHESAITCMRYTHNENWLVTSDGIGRIKYWKGRNELVKASPPDRPLNVTKIMQLSFQTTWSQVTSFLVEQLVRIKMAMKEA